MAEPFDLSFPVSISAGSVARFVLDEGGVHNTEEICEKLEEARDKADEGSMFLSDGQEQEICLGLFSTRILYYGAPRIESLTEFQHGSFWLLPQKLAICFPSGSSSIFCYRLELVTGAITDNNLGIGASLSSAGRLGTACA